MPVCIKWEFLSKWVREGLTGKAAAFEQRPEEVREVAM